MQLTVFERYMLIAILPTEGDFTTVRYLSKLRERLGLSEKEEEDFKVVTDKATGNKTWAKEHQSTEREIEIGETMTNVIVDALKELSETKRLKLAYVTLFEKFVEGPMLEKAKEAEVEKTKKAEPNG